MRTSIIPLIIFLFVCTFASGQINKANFLIAISQVETGNDNSKIGKSGERSAYQFMPVVWNHHSQISFVQATNNRAEADKVAVRHLNYLIFKLEKMGKPITVENLALCWNAGETKFRLEKLEPRHFSYAEKVSEVYDSLRSNHSQ